MAENNTRLRVKLDYDVTTTRALNSFNIGMLLSVKGIMLCLILANLRTSLIQCLSSICLSDLYGLNLAIKIK